MNAKRRSGLNPLAYLGVDPITPPMLVIEDRDPTDNDYPEYQVGAIWVVNGVTKIWMMVKKQPSAVNKWVQLYPGDGSGTNFFTADTGTAVQVGGYLNVFGGQSISTSATGNTLTIDLENNVTIVSSLTVTPLNAGVVVTNVSGLMSALQGTDLQFFMGNTGTTPSFYSWESSDGSVTITAGTPGHFDIKAVGGGGGGFGGLKDNAGNLATPALNIVNVIGDVTNITTTASGSTLTIHLADVITLPVTNTGGTAGIIKLGANRFINNFGSDNTFIGELAGALTLTVGSATGNTGVGTGVLNDLTISPDNSALGVGALTAVAGGTGGNTSLGARSGAALVSGHDNILIGKEAGIDLTSTESGNIIIGNDGVTGDSDQIIIGDLQTDCYIGGIYGSTGGAATNGIVSIDNVGKLTSSNGTNGQLPIGGGTGPAWATLTSSDASIIFTPGINQLDMVAVGGGGGGGITKLGADTGTPALPLLGQVDVTGGTNINTATLPNTVVVNLDDWISLPTTNAAGTAGGMSINSNRFMHAISTRNTYLGSLAGNLSGGASLTDNVGIGYQALTTSTGGQKNTAIGSGALQQAAGNDLNVAVGYHSLNACRPSPLNGNANSALGANSGALVIDGNYNTFLGYNAGSTTTTGSNNLLIGNGVTATAATTSNEIRIGNSSNNACYLYGISSGAVANAGFVTVNSSTKQLGTFAYTTTPGEILMGTTAGTTAWGSLTSSDSTISITPGLGPVIDIKTAGTKVAFHAIQSGAASNVTGDGTLYNLGASAAFSEIWDYSSSFYPGSGSGTKALFTAPKTGLYQFIVTVLASNLPAGATTRVDPINIVTSNRTYSLINPVVNYSTTSATQTVTFTAIADMEAADTAYFQFGLQTSTGTKTVGVGATYTTISGFFIA